MNVRRVLLHPPCSWALRWVIHDPAVDRAYTQWLHNLTNKDNTMRNPFTRRPTDAAVQAALEFNAVTGRYAAEASGNRVDIRVDAAFCGVLTEAYSQTRAE